MGKHTLSLSLILFLIITAAASQVWQADAASISQIGSSDRIDGQVWEEILLSPERETTFYVSLTPEGEAAIEAQFRLEKMLALFQDAGNLGKYQVYYGRNIIEITGGAGILNFLEDWPELERVTAYTLEKDSELRTQAAYEPESYTGTSQITGQVTAGDGVTALSGIRVTAYKHISGIEWHKYPSVFTGGDGSYTITGLASGIFRVKFEDQFGDYVPEYFDNKFSFELATNFDLAEGETASNINAALALAGKISGTITLGGDGTESGLVASAWSSTSGSWKLISNALTNGSGAYTIGGLMPGNYRVMFSDSSTYVPPRYVTEYYDNKLEIENAQDLTVLAGGLTNGIDADLGPYGSVEGNVRAEDGVTSLAGIFVDVYRYDTANLSWDYFSSVQTDDFGNYAVSGLGTEDIRVGFTDSSGEYIPEYYNNKFELASADNVEIDLGYPTTNINAELMSTSDTITFTKQTNGEDAEVPPGPYISVGDSVGWTYTITNNNNESISFTIVDDPPVTISCPTNTLQSGESTICTASGTAVEGQYSNTATVTVMPSGATPNFDVEDTSHYFGVKAGIEIQKSTNGFDADVAPGPYIEVGGAVSWTYSLTNTGNVYLSDIIVIDDQGVTVTCPFTSLETGDSMTCTASGTAIEGQYSNLGSVTANLPSGLGQVSDSDYSHYFGSTSPIHNVFIPLILR